MNNQALKLIVSLVFSAFLAFTSLEFIYLIPILILLFIEKLYFLKILKRVVLLNFFILFLVLFVYFQNPKEALELFFRTNLILLFNMALFFESKGYDIARGFSALKFPAKFISIFYFTISLIEYLFMEFKALKKSLKLRGFNQKISFFTYQTYGNIFAMMFIKAIKKAEDMNINMQTRGFKGEIYLLNKKELDKKFILLGFSVLIIIFIKVFAQ